MKNRTLIFALIALMTLGSSGCFNKKKTPSESPVISESLEESETSEVESPSENESTSESNSVTESESESESMSEEESESESESTSETESGSDSEEPPVEDLDAEKQAAIKELRDAFNELDMEDYSIKRWNNIVAKFNQGIKDINNAVTRSEINEIKNDVLAYFANSPKASEVTKGTWFDYHSADSNYQFDRDDNNNLVISYDGYPGHWVYCGTKNLETDVGKNNILSLTFRNDIEEEIEVCLQATDDNAAFKADTGITKVGPLETKTLVLHYDVNVTRLYFFIDSCNVHERQGQVTILKQELGYEEKQERAPKTVDINQAMTLDDQGANTGYTFTASDYPYLISRVDAVLKVEYHGNGNSLRWYGLHLFYSGSNHISVSDSQVHAQEFGSGDTAGQNIRVNCPIDQSSKIAVGDTMHMDVSYQASGLTFTVVSYTFYYTLWKGVETETIEVNRPIYQSGSSDGLSLSIPYSSFQKKGTVRRMDVTFTTVNTESYGKSQIHFSGFNFTTFPSGNNNVLNIGSLMNKSDATPKQATVSLYPTSTVDLTSGSSIVIDCWWASASDITVDSITMYTDNVNPPEAVTGLEAHPIDKGVILNWSPAENATSYDVYKDGDLYQEVASTYITIDNLVNGTEYTFGVVAKNLSGESDMVTIKGTPVEGASYDTFIETLNTNLENQIGSDGITNMFDAGSQYLNTSNNERLKSVISKMQNGEETTVAFFGGSITVGETASLKDEHNHAKGYAYYTYQWLKRNYDVQNKSRFVNGSICGTGSEIGIVRAKKDMLNYNPDLIFIEFAGNNGTTNFYKESYESLVRECLKLESNPCIVLVFSATYYSGSAEGYMKEVGDHYHLPMFTMDKALRAVCSKLDQSRTDPIFKAFTDDGTHPNDEGHQLYAKCLCYSLRTLIKKATDSPVGTISSTCFTKGNKFEGMTPVDNKTVNGEITSLGSFAAANTGTPSTRDQSDVTAFQQGWKKTSTTENNPMTIEVNAKNFVLIYEAGNADVSGDPKGNIVVTYTNKNDASDTGTLTWDVTKTIRQSTSGSTAITDQSSKGWQNPVGVLIFDKDVANDYIITIRMESADGICTIMAFGYTK